MYELCVISGKGGTGKTSVLASFAALATNAVLADADVDAADLHLVLGPKVRHEEDFLGGYIASIDPDICTGCGECLARCRFDAITRDFQVKNPGCEGCGVCEHFCPSGAITMRRRKSGRLYVSDTRHGIMVHAKLGIAEENSGLLVSRVRAVARETAEDTGADLVLVDGPPGIGCPVIAAVTGATGVLIVTEPTLSGAHDAKRVAGLAAHFGIPAFLSVNKWDLNPLQCEQIEKEAREAGVEPLARVPYDAAVTGAMVEEKSVVEFSDTGAAAAIRDLWKAVLQRLGNTAPAFADLRGRNGAGDGVVGIGG
ncbi:MAG: ATP-binding protein [Desulfatibacillaceae bacterium]